MLEYGLCCKLHWVRYRMKKWSIEGMNIAMLVKKSEWDSGPEPHSSKHPWPTACPVCQGGSLRELQQGEMVKSMPGPQPQYHILFLKWHPFCVWIKATSISSKCAFSCLSSVVMVGLESPPLPVGSVTKNRSWTVSVVGFDVCIHWLRCLASNKYLLIRIIHVLSLFIVVVYLR